MVIPCFACPVDRSRHSHPSPAQRRAFKGNMHGSPARGIHGAGPTLALRQHPGGRVGGPVPQALRSAQDLWGGGLPASRSSRRSPDRPREARWGRCLPSHWHVGHAGNEGLRMLRVDRFPGSRCVRSADLDHPASDRCAHAREHSRLASCSSVSAHAGRASGHRPIRRARLDRRTSPRGSLPAGPESSIHSSSKGRFSKRLPGIRRFGEQGELEAAVRVEAGDEVGPCG